MVTVGKPLTSLTTLTEIETGLTNGQRYSDASAATDRAAWAVVQRYCPDKTEQQCRESRFAARESESRAKMNNQFNRCVCVQRWGRAYFSLGESPLRYRTVVTRRFFLEK
jgi:hypothetical protein